MKKYRILSAISALALTGSLIAAPFSASAAVKIPRVYRYNVNGTDYLLYDAKNDAWYYADGTYVPTAQTDRQAVRFEDTIYTVDFAEMKVYDSDGNENEELNGAIAKMYAYAQGGVSWIGQSAEVDFNHVKKPVRFAAKPLNDEWFGFRVSILNFSDAWIGDYWWRSEFDWLEPDLYIVQNAGASSSIDEYTGAGDANLDGKFTVADSVLLARAAAEDETAKISELGISLADMDEDGELTVLDVTASLKALAGNDKEGLQ